MMKNYTRSKFLAAFLLLGVLLSGSVNAQTIQTYTYTGAAQQFVIPSCVSVVTITARGAQGGINANMMTAGGLGGMATGILTVTPGDILNIYVGGINGYNGGGPAGINGGCATANGGVGGGASDVRLNGNALTNRIIVAGGGGGGGGDRINGCGRGAGGGGGGGYYGGGGGCGYPQNSTTVPTGGTQLAGGNAGVSTFAAGQNGFAGTLGVGGGGGLEANSNQGGDNSAFPGGPGGGLVGGNGQQPATNIFTGQSGAGGSSYIGTLQSASTTSNVNSGNGSIVLSYYPGFTINITSTSSNSIICAGNTVTFSASSANTYSWSNGSNASSITVAPNSNTTYSVTGQVSSCTYTMITTLTVNPAVPSLTLTNNTPTVCLGKTATLTAAGANTYTWTGGVNNGVPFAPSTTTTYVVSGQNACGTTTAATTISVGPIPVLFTVNPATVCAGSPAVLSATATASSYSWQPGSFSGTSSSVIITPSASAVYTVTVSDGICLGTSTVNLTAKPLPVVTINSSAAGTVCAGDPVYLSAGGGVSYTWTPGLSSAPSITVFPTGPSVYSVGATNSLGCSAGISTIVLTVPVPTVLANADFYQVCKGGTVTLQASGANTYSWSTGTANAVSYETPLVTTVYSVTGTSIGCSATETIEISVYEPTITITGSTLICEGGTATLSATGANSYTWSNNIFSPGMSASPNVTTVYTLSTETATGSIVCPVTNTVQVTVNPLPTITAVSASSFICRGEQVTLTAGGGATYTWSTGSSGSTVMVTPTLSIPVNYSVAATGTNGCASSGFILLTVNACTGINENAAASQLMVYPNPGSGNIYIKAETDMSLILVNELGQLVQYVELNQVNDHQAKITGLNKGLYFLSGKNASQRIHKKILVNN